MTLKDDALSIYHSVLDRIDPGAAFRRKVVRDGSRLSFGGTVVDLAGRDRILVVSFGKAAWAMLDALEDVLGEDHAPRGGVVVSNIDPPVSTREGFTFLRGGHPYPDAGSAAAARAALDLVRGATGESLVIFLVSGGGSALMEAPVSEDIALEEVAALNRLLVGCGAPIDDINAVRKHVSAVKGGRLAAAAHPATCITLMVSDVPGGRPATIASGPTLPDPSTVATCEDVVRKYGLADRLPPAYRRLWDRGLDETPKDGDSAFESSSAFVLLSSDDALEAAAEAARARGYRVVTEMGCDDIPLPDAWELLHERLQEQSSSHPGTRVAVATAGEILCPVTGDGEGGRNQAFVLHAVPRIAGREIAVLSAGTDGIDGNSPATGAVADGDTEDRGRAAGMEADDFFRRSDSYNYFAALDDAIVIGALQNNVRDVRILLA